MLAQWQLRVFEFDFEVVHCADIKHQTAYALSRLRTDGTDNAPLEDELPVFVIASDEKRDDATTTIFALEAHSSRRRNFVTDADGTDTHHPRYRSLSTPNPQMHTIWTPPNKLVKLEQNSRSINKECWWDARLLMELYRSSCRSHKRLLSLSHHAPISGHPDNVACMTPCNGTFTGRIWLVVYMEMWAAIKVVSEVAQNLRKSATYNFHL